MAVGRLGDRVQALDRAPADRERASRAGNVGDREAELARAAGEPLGGAIEVLVARQCVEEVVELLGVVVLLAGGRLCVDREHPGDRVGLGDRQVDVHERVAVAELALALLAVMEADRDLRPQARQPLAGVLEPAAQAAGDAGEEDVVDGHVARQRGADCLQLRERDSREGELAGGADPAVENGVRGAVAELAHDGAGHPRELGGEPAALASRARPASCPPPSGASTSSQSTSRRKRTELIPSAIAWWIRQTIASRPSASGPTTSKRHSGRSWSRRCDISAAAAAQAPRSSMPWVPSARRTWAAISKPSSATQLAGGPSSTRLRPRERARQPRIDRCPQAPEVERLGGRLEDDQLQRVTGDRRGLEPEDPRVVGAEQVRLVAHPPTVTGWSRGARAARRATRTRRLAPAVAQLGFGEAPG